jgi:hypothetical protein
VGYVTQRSTVLSAKTQRLNAQLSRKGAGLGDNFTMLDGETIFIRVRTRKSLHIRTVLRQTIDEVPWQGYMVDRSTFNTYGRIRVIEANNLTTEPFAAWPNPILPPG